MNSAGDANFKTAWAVTSSWRGDLKLFARIADKATQMVGETGKPTPCRIEFAVRNDLERYHSVDELLERSPASTLRSFNSARIQVGDVALRVEVTFGRKADSNLAFEASPGVSVEVSSDGTVDQEVIERVRTEVSVVVARGGFPHSRPPATGPTSGGPDRKVALADRWRLRQTSAQIVFGGITALVLTVAFAIYSLFTKNSESHTVVNVAEYVTAVIGVAQIASFPISTFLFPAIEIADVTPGRRIVQVIGRSGVVTAVVGVAGAYFRSKVG